MATRCNILVLFLRDYTRGLRLTYTSFRGKELLVKNNVSAQHVADTLNDIYRLDRFHCGVHIESTIRDRRDAKYRHAADFEKTIEVLKTTVDEVPEITRIS